MEIVGVLRNARRVPKGEDPRAPCLAGQVYNDTKGRFHDGAWITTSTIMEELPDGVFKTRFSAYRVASWEGQSPANDNLTPRAYFDARTALQEELAINISAQIANGVKPDAVQVLEWANALYEAEVGAA
ncbi:hypothetical protein ACWIGM_08805 [Bosea sp. NPDC055332]